MTAAAVALKIAIICHAGPQDGARAWHALLYAKELAEHGHAVRLIFDGAGATWARAYEKPETRHHDTWEALKKLGVVTAVCDFCATAFGVHDDTVKSGLPHLGEYNGHPSFAALVEQGFQVIVL